MLSSDLKTVLEMIINQLEGIALGIAPDKEQLKLARETLKALQ